MDKEYCAPGATLIDPSRLTKDAANIILKHWRKSGFKFKAFLDKGTIRNAIYRNLDKANKPTIGKKKYVELEDNQRRNGKKSKGKGKGKARAISPDSDEEEEDLAEVQNSEEEEDIEVDSGGSEEESTAELRTPVKRKRSAGSDLNPKVKQRRVTIQSPPRVPINTRAKAIQQKPVLRTPTRAGPGRHSENLNLASISNPHPASPGSPTRATRSMTGHSPVKKGANTGKDTVPKMVARPEPRPVKGKKATLDLAETMKRTSKKTLDTAKASEAEVKVTKKAKRRR